MIESMMIGFTAKLLMIIVALLAIRVSLIAFDKSLGFDFKGWLNNLEENDPKSLALYFGLRFIGIAMLAGLVLG